jgi:hypothetical protein
MNLAFLVGLGFGLTELFEYVLILNVSVIVRLPFLFFHAFTTSILAYGVANKKPIAFYVLAVFDTSGHLFLIAFLLAGCVFFYLYQKTPQEQIPY